MSAFRRRIQYRVNRAFARGSSLLYVALAAVATVVVFAGANAFFLGLFSEEALRAEGISNALGGGFWDSLLWSLKHVIDPGAFAEDYGAPTPVLVIALLISVLGLVIFGTLIGFIASLVQRRIEMLESGNTPVVEQGHTLLLGWNPKAPAVLRRLSDFGPRVVVVLAPREQSRMREALRSEGVRDRDVEVVLRTGSPSRIAELRNVAVRDASSIIVLGTEPEDGSEGDPDIEVIKTLLVLASLQDWPHGRPHIVGEIQHKPNLEIARIASRAEVPLVSSTEVVGRLLVQAARYGGVSRVYAELFSAQGGAIHVRRLPGVVGMKFRDLAFAFSGAVPIGISWTVDEGGSQRTAVALNLEPDYELDHEEDVVLLSPGARYSSNLGSRAPATSHTQTVATDAFEPPIRRVLILGWNRMVSEMLLELDAHAQARIEVLIAANRPEDQMRSQLEAAFESPLLHVALRCVQLDTVRRNTFDAIDPTGVDRIFVLAGESGLGRDPDANTILTLLLLRDHFERHAGIERPAVIAEIREPRNRELLEDTIADDVVVSPQVVSVLITQISQLPVLGPVYGELLSAEGIEICLRPALRYASAGKPVRFCDLVAAGQVSLETVLGLIRAGEDGGDPTIELAPPLDASWTLGEHDRLIVLAQRVYA